MTSLEPTLTRPDDVAVLDHLDFLCRVVLRGEDTAGTLAVVEERGRLGCQSPRHVHDREAETFLVLDGALEGWCEGVSHLVEAGSVLHLPPAREHAFRVVSAEARFLVLVTPAGFENFFEETGRVVQQPFEGPLPTPGPVPPEAVERLVAALVPYACTLTGPPPFDGEAAVS